MSGDDPLARLRALCLALPEVTERVSHGSPSFFAARPMFVTWVDDLHGDGVTGFWCAAPPGEQEQLIAADPVRFFRPPYVGHRGWLGVRLETDDGRAPDWVEVAEIVTDAWRTVAVPRLLARLDGG